VRNLKSFIDVLFILLLSTIVMLTQTAPLGALDVKRLTRGSGGASPIRADEVELVQVAERELMHQGRAYADPALLAGAIQSDRSVLLLVTDPQVSHQRVMNVWSELSAQGLDVNLGSAPGDDT
jgi:biopolymer transport protein ExbD